MGLQMSTGLWCCYGGAQRGDHIPCVPRWSIRAELSIIPIPFVLLAKHNLPDYLGMVCWQSQGGDKVEVAALQQLEMCCLWC